MRGESNWQRDPADGRRRCRRAAIDVSNARPSPLPDLSMVSILERSMTDGFLSNTYLSPTGGGRPPHRRGRAGRAAARRRRARGLTLTHVLLTHHHYDHVAELGELLERYPDSRSSSTRSSARPSWARPATIDPGEPRDDRRPRRRAAPHAGPHRGDALLRSSTAPTSSPATRSSRTPSAACARPATRPTRTSQRLDHGPADGAPARDDRSIPATPTRRRSARSGRPTRSSASGAASTPRATSRARRWASPPRWSCSGDDYDGGHKAWVRWPDGSDDIVPGSQVQRGLSGACPPAGRGPSLPCGDMARATRSPPRACAGPPGSAALAAGQAARQFGTRAANVAPRARRARTRALERRQLEAAEQIVTALGTMKGAAMKLGQVHVVPRRRPGARGVPRGVPAQARRAARRRAQRSPSSEMRKVIEDELDEPLADGLRGLRRGADRRRLDRAGLPRHAAGRARRSPSRSSTRGSRRRCAPTCRTSG